MVPTQTAVAATVEPKRIFIACINCKTRKRRCNGETPKCANCVARNVECTYAPVRKTRGPAKKREQRDAPDEPLGRMQHPLLLTLPHNDGNPGPDSGNDAIISKERSTRRTDPGVHDGVAVSKQTSLQPSVSTDSSQTQVSIRNRIPIFPDFLLPGTFDANLKEYKTIIAEGIAARNFTPLMPRHIARRLIENSFAEIMAEHQLITLSHFITHLDAQCAANSLDPGDTPARWAFVNAVLALGARSKTVPDSEVLSNIVHGYYQNATKVVPELILQEPCLLSIQALLAMAIFARDSANTPAFVMLASNASRQLELLSSSWSSMGQAINFQETEQYEQAFRTADIFKNTIREVLGPNIAL